MSDKIITNTYLGYHGTRSDAKDNILTDGLKSSKGNSEWLGDGGYFFLHGVSSHPEKDAENWAIAQAWDDKSKAYLYDKYAVIECKIESNKDKVLDLRNDEDIQLLNYIKEKNEDKLLNIKKKGKLLYIDGILINFAMEEHLISPDVIISNAYIKFKKERMRNINSRIPNCTICSIRNPLNNIHNYKLVMEGDIAV